MIAARPLQKDPAYIKSLTRHSNFIINKLVNNLDYNLHKEVHAVYL